ncbi:conserved unknown protein [Ectocarpus siliculosus]|uniref:Uncharacterized protein n=1 Tax=Ectocarpus siliculosus TaxID=2880 RepID=D7FUZ6_ECTSI|nr:conserved unknown protein [Ectocarpus siliculosus]|eukprot:CBJ31802.1 conserved unknown protein [Ectocarpus siliculosus]
MAEPSLVGAISEGRRVPAVTVFGWDDVLCPTTHAKLERNSRAESKQERIQLLNVGQSVVRLVRAAQRHGPVVIVTDSHEGWVRGTAELLLPGGAAAACLENVEVVSSRDRFAKDFPDQPACWQIAAFSYVTNRHLLSRGATDRFREHHPNVVAKTVSLMEGPTPLELKNQLDLLADKFRLMFGHASSSLERPDSAPAPAAAASTRAPVSSPKVRRREGGGGALSDDGDDDDLTSEDDDEDDGSLLLRGDAVKPGRLNTGTLDQGRHLSRWGYGDGDSDDYMTPPCSASTVSSNGSLAGSESGGGSVLPGWASSASGSGPIPSPPGPLPAASCAEGPQS